MLGRSTDLQITRHCGILDLLEPGDDLMADRGFEIDDYLPQSSRIFLLAKVSSALLSSFKCSLRNLISKR